MTPDSSSSPGLTWTHLDSAGCGVTGSRGVLYGGPQATKMTPNLFVVMPSGSHNLRSLIPEVFVLVNVKHRTVSELLDQALRRPLSPGLGSWIRGPTGVLAGAVGAPELLV